MSTDVSKVKSLKRQIVLASKSAGEGHIPSAFSILDILWVLYDKVLRVDAKEPKKRDRDRFVLSKGHGSLALYAVLADKKFFPESELNLFATFGGILGGHPDRNKVPGIEASTGSLGHGMPFAVGLALAAKIREHSWRVFVLVGDGECNEGSIWESALLAAHHNLSNLTCIIDHNHSTDRSLVVDDLVEKFSSFGWRCSIVDGHDHAAILEALAESDSAGPRAIIAKTVKGAGTRLTENNPAWHHKSPSDEELKIILEDLQ